MKFAVNFLKGIIVGIGGIAPGLSGSVMLIVLGLYEKAIKAIGTIHKQFKKSIIFLIPLVSGFGVGVVLFSKLIDFLLKHHEFETRYAFLGLVLGTIPLFYKEVKKHGYNKKYYIFVVLAAVGGVLLFSVNKQWFGQMTNPGIFQSALLGVAVAGSSIVPGVDSAVILSSLGLYEIYVSSLAEFNLSVLIPALVGLVIGAILISTLMHFLIKRFYTMTFSIIFGLFLSIVPNVLNQSCTISSGTDAAVAATLIIAGFLVSFYLEDIKGNNMKIKKKFIDNKLKHRVITLFTTFFKIGAFTFGGGYAMIPLIQREVSEKRKWITDEDILDIVAIAESTPGPIAINSATFVGFKVAGFWGAFSSTLGVVLPSFVVISAISFILDKFQSLTAVQFAFNGIRAGVLALILKAFVSMYKQCPKNLVSYIVAAAAFVAVSFFNINIIYILIACAVFGVITSAIAKKKVGGNRK